MEVGEVTSEGQMTSDEVSMIPNDPETLQEGVPIKLELEEVTVKPEVEVTAKKRSEGGHASNVEVISNMIDLVEDKDDLLQLTVMKLLPRFTFWDLLLYKHVHLAGSDEMGMGKDSLESDNQIMKLLAEVGTILEAAKGYFTHEMIPIDLSDYSLSSFDRSLVRTLSRTLARAMELSPESWVHKDRLNELHKAKEEAGDVIEDGDANEAHEGFDQKDVIGDDEGIFNRPMNESEEEKMMVKKRGRKPKEVKVEGGLVTANFRTVKFNPEDFSQLTASKKSARMKAKINAFEIVNGKEKAIKESVVLEMLKFGGHKIKIFSCRKCRREFLRKEDQITHESSCGASLPETKGKGAKQKAPKYDKSVPGPPKEWNLKDLNLDEELLLKLHYIDENDVEVLMAESALKEHLKSKEMVVWIFPCQKCGKGFSTEEFQTRHEMMCKADLRANPLPDTSVLNGKIKCIVDGCTTTELFTSRTSRALTKHHTECHVKPEDYFLYRHFCAKTFGHRRLRNEHVHISCDKKYACEECGKNFSFPKNLQLHRDTQHYGIRPFPCDQCDFKATKASILARHKVTKHEHKRVQNVFCDRCGRGFRSAHFLASHIKFKHAQPPKKAANSAEEKIHACDVCDFKTHNKYYLTNHKKNLHDASSKVMCNICGVVLKHKDSLYYHNKRFHNKNAAKAGVGVTEGVDVKIDPTQATAKKPWSAKRRAFHQNLLLHGAEGDSLPTDGAKPKRAKKAKLPSAVPLLPNREPSPLHQDGASSTSSFDSHLQQQQMASLAQQQEHQQHLQQHQPHHPHQQHLQNLQHLAQQAHHGAVNPIQARPLVTPGQVQQGHPPQVDPEIRAAANPMFPGGQPFFNFPNFL